MLHEHAGDDEPRERAIDVLAFLERSEGLGVANYGGMKGVYLVGDWCSGRVFGLGWDGRKWQLEELAHTSLQFTAGGIGEDGYVYGVNTFGSILGAVAAGLILMPLLGLKLLLASGAAIDMAFGVVLLARPLASR